MLGFNKKDMKIINDQLRKSAVILFENIEEDLGIYCRCPDDTKILIEMWKEEYSEKFFENNPAVDDVLLLWVVSTNEKILEWVISKETKYNKWVDQSCELIKSKRDWLDGISRMKYNLELSDNAITKMK